jgi:GT2 family glycosyltransferase
LDSVSAVVTNFNGARTLKETVASLKTMDPSPREIIVVDDGSTDGSPEEVERSFPDVKVIRLGRNTRRLNVVRNSGITAARHRRVLLTDNDVTFASDCLVRLDEVMAADPSVGIATPRMMYADEPDRIYADASSLHYLATSVSQFRGRSVSDGGSPRPTVGGGICLIDREKFDRLGGFDEDYWLGWGDDGEFYHRMRMAGHKCLYVPSAVCFHEAKAWGGGRFHRAEGQVRNRWHFILTLYGFRTLVSLAPALALYEILLFLFMLAKGLAGMYVRGNAAWLREVGVILEKRRRAQEMRRVSDGDLLSSGPIYVNPELVRHPAWRLMVRAVTAVFDSYYFLARRCF